MNILCVGYFDKFSRFFLAIEKHLKKGYPNVKLNILSINISGFLYTLIRFKFSYLITFKSWIYALKNKKKYFDIINNFETYKSINYKDLINYHKKLNGSIFEKHLLIQSLAYIDILENLFIKLNPKIILLIGDSRLSIETTIALAKKFNVKIYYIEQGPFNTTFFNDSGVNANVAINHNSYKKDFSLNKEVVDNFINESVSEKYSRSYVYRGIDYLICKIFEKTIFYPPDLKYTDTFSPIFKVSKNTTPLIIDNECTVFLLVLQVPLDINMIYHSPYFKNHYSILKAIHENLPNNSQLIIREHPLFKGKYEKEFYAYAKKHSISFDSNKSFKETLKNTKVVVVNNSTLGVEAIALRKNVVVLGNAYYNNNKICLKYEGKLNLKTILENSISFTPSTKSIYTFLYNLIQNNLVQGQIKDIDLIASKTISLKIKAEFQNKQ